MGDRRFRSLVRQMLLSEEYDRPYEPEAPADAPLGKYAFADILNRVEWGPRPPPYEQNTPEEEDLRAHLVDHFLRNDAIPQEQIDQIKGYMSLGYYSDIFSEPPAGVIYRGLYVPNLAFLKKILPNIDVNNVPLISESVLVTNRFNFDVINKMMLNIDTTVDITNKAGKYTTSWTKDPTQAVSFSSKSGKILEGDFGIVFCANVEDNPGKFIDCEGLYQLRHISSYDGEREVIGVGTVRVNRVLVCSFTEEEEDHYADE